MMKTFRFWFLVILFSVSLIAVRKNIKVLMNDPLRIGKYALLNYEENIEIIANKNSLAPAALNKDELIELNRLIVEYTNNKNRAIEKEVKKEVRESPHNSEMIKNSKYLHDPEFLLPAFTNGEC